MVISENMFVTIMKKTRLFTKSMVFDYRYSKKLHESNWKKTNLILKTLRGRFELPRGIRPTGFPGPRPTRLDNLSTVVSIINIGRAFFKSYAFCPGFWCVAQPFA